ncbi:MAG: NUDIX domain-containing protein [Flavobacterium sp.]
MRTKTRKHLSRRKRKTQRHRKPIKGGTDAKAGVVLYDNIHKKIMTVSNDFDDNIGIPKGNIERGESELEAAFRELSEETGIVFHDLPPILKKFYTYDGAVAAFVVLFPNGSVTIGDYVNQTPRENIKYITWRNRANLMDNIHITNKTIRTKKYNIADQFFQLFITDYKETNAPAITMFQYNQNADLDGLMSVTTHPV